MSSCFLFVVVIYPHDSCLSRTTEYHVHKKSFIVPVYYEFQRHLSTGQRGDLCLFKNHLNHSSLVVIKKLLKGDAQKEKGYLRYTIRELRIFIYKTSWETSFVIILLF
jgi:hypothetical protein